MAKQSHKVLIIEDDIDLQEIYRYAFEDGGYQVKVSNNGRTGIADVIKFKPDIILLDIMMPEMNGYQFMESLNNTTAKIPVVIVTNLVHETEKQKALDAGASLFLTKAEYDGPDLVKRIDQLLASDQVKNNK